MPLRHLRARAERRGTALVASMVVVMVLSFMGAAMIQVLSSRTKRQLASIDNVKALYIAEAGLSESFLAVSQGKTGNVGSEATPAAFANGFYWVEAAETDSGQVALVSHGMCGTGRFSLALCVQRQVNPVGILGVFGDQELSIGSGTTIDGYDSRDGSYESQIDHDGAHETTGGGARVGSNGEIRIGATDQAGWQEPQTIGMGGEAASPEGAPTYVYGDARPGPLSTAVMDPWVEVSGSTSPRFDVSVLPPIKVPPLATTASLLLVGQGRQSGSTSISGLKAYDHLRVAAGGSLRLQGPLTLVVGRFEVDSLATVTIDSSGGPVSLYVTEQLDLAPDSSLQSTTEDSSSVALLVTAVEGVDHDGDGFVDPAVFLRSSGVICGLFYAPHADVVLPASLRLMGSITARTLAIEAGARISFDHSLAYLGEGVETIPRMISWHIVGLPDAPYLTQRVDPAKLLDEHGIVARPSKDAHFERSMEVDYVDSNGSLQTYAGSPQGLDWSNVGQILSVDWFDAAGNPVDPFTWNRDLMDRPLQTTYDIEVVEGRPSDQIWTRNGSAHQQMQMQ